MIDIRNYFAPSVLYPGLQITVQAGIVLVNGSGVLLPTQDIALPANSTSSIYLNTQTAAIQVAGSFPVTNCYPIAVAVTGTGVVNSLIDSRPDIGGVGGGGGGAWSGITNATADLTLANAGFNTTFNQTSATNWTWANTTAATGSVSQSSPVLNINGTYWDGAASQTDKWTLQDVIANGNNGTPALTFTHTGSSGLASLNLVHGSNSISFSLGTTQNWKTSGNLQIQCGGNNVLSCNANGNMVYNGGGTFFLDGTADCGFSGASGVITATGALKLDNATAATSGVSQSSPVYTSSGRYWDGAASQTDSWTMQDVIANGTNGTSTLTFTHAGTSGATAVLVPTINVGATGCGWQRIAAAASFQTDCLRVLSNGNNIGWSHGVNSSNVGVMATANGAIGWSNNNNPHSTTISIGFTNPASALSGVVPLYAQQVNAVQNMFAKDGTGFIGFQGIPNGISVAALTTPVAPTVTVAAGSGATTWGYKVAAKDASGATIASSEGTVANNATLNGNSVQAVNKVLITRINGAVSYDVYRTTVGTSPNTTGVIGNIADVGTLYQGLGANQAVVSFINDFGSNSTVTAVAAPSGGTSGYTCGGTLAIGNSNGCAGLWITIAGCVDANNNGRFFCIRSNSGTLFLINPNSTLATAQTGTATVAGDGATAPSVNTSGGVVANRFSATGLRVFANNAAAVTGGLAVGDFYRTNGDPDLVAVVH